jgi:hypothetical protein
MPINIKVIQTKDFIRTKADGSLDMSTSREVLVELASMIATPGEYHVLVDTRDAVVTLSPLDLYMLGVGVAQKATLAHTKIAVLVSLGEEDRANLMALVAQNRGALLKVFSSFEEAIVWLVAAEHER